ncbi:hypothetical protein QA612_18030 [Evansella sp. AB-P1]|nr:hypothetical protein [Evansella sp. AB-P1]MDG5789363.1 hypothetical protein [Evansella sp. AB-P1]
MATRDVNKLESDLPYGEYVDLVMEAMKKYEKEFEKNDIANLTIDSC